MKTKTSLWLGVCTLVLCLGVMTFGVYSAISANLNIGGTLGFNMHNCMVTVQGIVYNLAEMPEGQNYANRIDKPIERTIMGGENTTTASISLGDMYFYYGAYTDAEGTTSKVYDMIFEISFKNVSSTAIMATIPAPTVGTGVTIVTDSINGYTTFPISNKIIAQNGTYTVKFALRLNNSDALSNNVDFFWNIIKFEEFSLLSLVKGDSTTGYYLEMGEYNGTALKWYPFAKLDEAGNVIATLSNGRFSYKNELTSGSYYFISEKVLDNTIVAFNSSGYVNDLSKHYGLDYNGSTVQTYITGNMLTEYKIPADDVVYKAITQRTLKGEAYMVYDRNDDLVEDTTGKYVTHDTPDQSLWLLSKTEADYLESTENTVASKYGYPVTGGSSPAFWWLRSPFLARYSGDACLWSVLGYSNVDFCDVYREDSSVRPAFQIQL